MSLSGRLGGPLGQHTVKNSPRFPDPVFTRAPSWLRQRAPRGAQHACSYTAQTFCPKG
ncbi:hypothetical protein SGPA1_21518 [Streptomyces misionensis JCM 4497]